MVTVHQSHVRQAQEEIGHTFVGSFVDFPLHHQTLITGILRIALNWSHHHSEAANVLSQVIDSGSCYLLAISTSISLMCRVIIGKKLHHFQASPSGFQVLHPGHLHKDFLPAAALDHQTNQNSVGKLLHLFPSWNQAAIACSSNQLGCLGTD